MEDQPTQLDFTEFATQIDDDFMDEPTQIDYFDDRPKKGFILRQETIVDQPNHIRAKSFLMKQGTVVDRLTKSPSKFLTPPKASPIKR